MKKKILLSILVLVGIFTITGCGNTNNENKKVEKNDIEETTTKVTISDYDIEFDTNGKFYEMNYKYEKTFSVEDYNNARIINLKNNNIDIINIRMIYYNNKGINEIINSLEDTTTSEVKFNNKTWKMTQGIEDSYHYNQYFYENKNNTYVVIIFTKDESKDFNDIFMKNIKFN